MQILRDFVYHLLPRPRPAGARTEDGERVASQLLILSRHPNPSFSYYLDERAKTLSKIPVITKGLDDPLDAVDSNGLFVIICRYIKQSQLRWLEERRHDLAGVAYFVDDDIPAVLTGNEASWPYKFRLIKLAVRPLPRVNRLLTHVWTSTETLASALARPNQRIDILPPFPTNLSAIGIHGMDESIAPLRMVYHATGIHRREHEFLMPIVKAAMEKHVNLHFEVFAADALARRWGRQGIDPKRIAIIPPLSWPAYLARTMHHNADIALAPLLSGKTNASRSDTKRIDIGRLRAAAIFSRCPTFERCAIAGEIHIGNTPEEWLAAIDQLIGDRERRAAARDATRHSIDRMRQHASPAFPGINFEPLSKTA
ncbi:MULTISPECIES: hypothetical protein [unclassified Rhizobium]|uniref:hypothetical protein n=1 Tax=unclassified Rhizobium TaxID=2613769 RepID=UPI000EAA0664|nr:MULTISPECIES: hypothetical protein [unclassified Rhizobium]AYG65824.1 hypothetical protein CCGE531_07290 [Rhizobium sp. CCGE531]AYG72305.1 hypothetical protein CCGE532_07290 [Rhizobium sp. CCGE532]